MSHIASEVGIANPFAAHNHLIEWARETVADGMAHRASRP
jgi:hypothetical protein